MQANLSANDPDTITEPGKQTFTSELVEEKRVLPWLRQDSKTATGLGLAAA
jgi:hypothetical protein